MEEGDIPTEWKSANVSPIYKKVLRIKQKTTGQSALHRVLCKIMESFIKERVVAHLTSNNLLSSKQFRFISGRSTVTQLLRYLGKCIDTIVNGGVVDAIYLDFQKAFDIVPHRRLMGKIQSYGVRGRILTWIKSFLTGRTQVVRVNGSVSESAPVLSGIPQGSVLGPLMFVIYINDLPEAINSYSFLFADDTKVFREINSKDDAFALQSDIDSLQHWSNKCLLQFHLDKCHVLTLGKFDNIRYTHRYRIYEHELEHVFEEKDLGVIFESDLKCDEHISAKVRKANAIVGLIRRTFSFLDCRIFKKLYITFVRPHLEYAQAVWSPHLKENIDILEEVQFRATKIVDGLANLDYPERQKKLDLPTLVYRRARGDVIEVFKHLHTNDRKTLPHHFCRHKRTSRIHDHQLVTIKPKDGTRGLQTNSFYYRVIRTWNLQRIVVNAGNINSFRNDKVWNNIRSKYDPSSSSDS